MYKDIAFKDFEKRDRASFINSLSGFKSANLIGTINQDGLSNLAIFSSLFHLGADPALFGFIVRPDSVPRHSLLNIRTNHTCTVNHISYNMTKDAHQTSARYDDDVSEFSQTNFNEEYLDGFKAPFVKESHIKFSANLVEEVIIKHNGTHMLIMNIEKVYLDPEFIRDDSSIDLEKAQTACISGLNAYHRTTIIDKYPYAKVIK